jgi:hypothetical protein
VPFFPQTKLVFAKNYNNISLHEKRHFFRRKWAKIAQNSDNNINPRPKLLAMAVLVFSVSGTLMGIATEYWHLVVLRMLIAAG